MKRTACLAFALAAASAHAGDFSTIGNLTQEEFRRVAQDLGAAVSYKGVTPATPLGVLGFDLAVVLTSTSVENSGLFGLAGAGSQSELTIPKLHIYKGLFAGLDIGAFVGSMPDLAGNVFGADLRYAFLDDTLTTPALAVRISGTTTNGLGGVDVATAAVDVMVSKRFTALTPYVGAGGVRVKADPGAAGLSGESFKKGRAFAGLNLNLAFLNVASEVEKLGDNTSLSAKLGWRF